MKGKVAIVTGSSRGIGAEIVKALAHQGVNVVINYLKNKEQAEIVAKECIEIGVKAEIFAGDVSNFSIAKDLVDFAILKFGSVDILVNNAGKTSDTLIMRMTEQQFDDVINSNLKSAFNMTKHVTPIMMKSRYGKIVNISSVAGVCGNMGQANYSASKAGIIGLTKATSKELGARNITVNAVAPGFIDTDMTASLPEQIKDYVKVGASIKRMGKASEVADLVVFLSSEKSDYITGQVIRIDGGLVL